jgi:hypothetical protein
VNHVADVDPVLQDDVERSATDRLLAIRASATIGAALAADTALIKLNL